MKEDFHISGYLVHQDRGAKALLVLGSSRRSTHGGIGGMADAHAASPSVRENSDAFKLMVINSLWFTESITVPMGFGRITEAKRQSYGSRDTYCPGEHNRAAIWKHIMCHFHGVSPFSSLLLNQRWKDNCAESVVLEP